MSTATFIHKHRAVAPTHPRNPAYAIHDPDGQLRGYAVKARVLDTRSTFVWIPTDENGEDVAGGPADSLYRAIECVVER